MFTNMAPVLFKDPTLHASLDQKNDHGTIAIFPQHGKTIIRIGKRTMSINK